jgi:hypothetical protein
MDVSALQSMFSTLPVDVVAAVLFATIITVLTLRAGASVAIAFSISILLSQILFASLTNTFLIGAAASGISSPYVGGGIYLALTLVLTFILYRATSTVVDDSARPLLAILTGAATTIVVLTAWHLAPSLQGLWHFNPMVQAAFSEAYRLYWLIVAFTIFAFVKS